MTGFQFKYVIRTQRGENKKLPSYLSNWEVFFLAPPTGLEPVTLRLTVECSAN